MDKVIVSTDDEKIADAAKEHGAEVPFVRPSELAADTSSSISVLEHAICWFKDRGESYDYIVLLEPTSPLTSGGDVDKALMRLHQNRDFADSIVGISRLEATHPEFNVILNDQGLIETVRKSNAPVRRQDLETLYYFDGSLYISDVQALQEKKNFYHDRTLGHTFPKWQAFEVDDVVDLICVRAIFSNLNEVKKDHVE